jgi:hypothetical protein
MPTLIVYGMPESTEEVNWLEAFLPELVDDLRSSVGKVLEISDTEVSVFFPCDRMSSGLGEELICIVEGVFEKQERTSEVRKRMAEVISDVLGIFAVRRIPNCKKVEATINRFNQEIDGFAVRDLENRKKP